MNIDNLISSFGFKKLNKDCILHNTIRTYIEKKSEPPPRDHNKVVIFKKQFEEYSGVLERLINHAKCFPNSCDNCEGLTKCIDCIIKDTCVEAQLEFNTLIYQTETA